MATVRRLALVGLLLLPGAATVYTAFHGGGFFVGTQGGLAVALALLLLLRVTLSDDPFAGVGAGLVVAAAALGLLGGWSLLSSTWSDAPARALIDANRYLLYALALVLFGSLPMTRRRLRILLWGFGAGALAVCTCSLITRTLPEVWEVAPNIANERLAYPITYWNTLGLLAALGIVVALHLSCDDREPRVARVLGAGAMPVFAATLYLTLSRASIALCLVAVVAYLALARPRTALTGLVAALVPAAIATVVAYDADVLVTARPDTPEGVDQGERVATAVAVCVAAAMLARAALLWLDARIVARPARTVPRAVALGAVAAAVVVGAAGFAVAGGPGYVSDQVETFVERPEPLDEEDLRARLTDPSSNGRIPHWEVALDAWRADPWRGNGAATFENLWYRERPDPSIVHDAHSLYLEALAELGTVGGLLILVCVLALLAGAAARVRGPQRALHAAVLCSLGVWALHAGVDWDWEMPVVTLWAFCLGGAVLATPRPAGEDVRRVGWQPPRLARVLVGLGCLLLAVTPVRLAQSQDNLNDAVQAFRDGRCADAIDDSLAALEAVSSRPEPRLVLTYCNLSFGRADLALRQVREAADSDPESWTYHYVLALVQARLGRDPRPELALAARLNPQETLVREARERFDTSSRRAWRREADRTPVPGI